MRLFNDNWSFYRSEPDVDVTSVRGELSQFRPVDIPHDWLIYDTENLYQDGTGWYCKHFSVDRAQGARVMLRFEGVYMDSRIYLNGELVKEWKYGYSTFDVDLTEHLRDGENELLVEVRFLSPNSRWYSGAGIYRNVWLKQCGEAYLPMDGSYVVIREQEDARWKIEISTETAGCAGGTHAGAGADGTRAGNGADGTCAGENAGGNYRCRYLLEGPRGQEILGESAVAADGLAQLTAYVERPLLWDVEEPNCYRLTVELLDKNGSCVDTDCQTVGFRTLEFTANRGFFLNHRHLKLHGVCEHHDLGCLGAAFHKEAMRRKFRILREMGVNALRTSHNMPAPELMELADEMGFLVLDEAFDMWELSKTQYDYARFFNEWAERDVASWIRRDRNHPCLLMWSIGNEIYDTHAGERGKELTLLLTEYVLRHDPRENARVTLCSNYVPWENTQKCMDTVKLAGYNYGEKYYAPHHEKYADWSIYGSETASIVYSRGVYHFPLAQSCLSEVDEQCSSLGNSATSWGAQSIERLITEDRDCEYSMGQFLWTGFDYIGEPTPYHTKNSYFGQIDTAGFPKDAYYVFQSAWRDAADYPMVHLFPYWDWNEGQMIDVQACTNGESVELFVNGKSLGRQEIDQKNGEVLLAKWQVAYEPGELLAVAYDGDGREIARQAKHSFGESAAVVLEADKTTLLADGEDLCFVTVGMVDPNGHPVENAMDYVTVAVDGPGRLLGLDNGDSTDYDRYKTDRRKLFNGKLLAVIGATGEPGEITLRVEPCVDKIAGASIRIAAERAAAREGISCGENCCGESSRVGNCCGGDCHTADAQAEMPAGKPRFSGRIPARKLELSADGKRSLTPQNPSASVRVRLLPADTTDRGILWEAVNDAGIPLDFIKVEPTGEDSVWVEAQGDGAFRVRCLCKDDRGRVRILSQLEFEATGFGQAHLNPYGYISAGLYARCIGEVAGGNEKGIAFARDDWSAAIYEKIDFGPYGSDMITADIFALSPDPYTLEIWEGVPVRPGEAADAQSGRLISTLVYQKPSIWNTYQPETWKLPERLSGLKEISIVMYDKVHMKGFSFLRLEKAFQRLTGGDCTQVYGDSFRRDGDVIRDIGNNVTIVYEDMDFGDGASSVTIWGDTPHPVNTVHLRFVAGSGEESRAIVEYPGGTAREHTFPVDGFRGKGKLELVFLPGSDFTLEAFQFEKTGG